MSGNRKLLLVRSRDEEQMLAVPGWEVVPCAVCRIVQIPGSWSGRADAALLTSRHAVPWFLEHAAGFEGPVAVAGASTARLLEARGLPCRVSSRQGGEAALEILAPEAGMRVLYPCGERTAGTVEAAAARLGIELERREAYRLEPWSDRKAGVRTDVQALAFLSGQMVRFFLQLASRDELELLRRLPVVCTDSARNALEACGWSGRILRLEKKTGQEDISRLLLMAALPS